LPEYTKLESPGAASWEMLDNRVMLSVDISYLSLIT